MKRVSQVMSLISFCVWGDGAAAPSFQCDASAPATTAPHRLAREVVDSNSKAGKITFALLPK